MTQATAASDIVDSMKLRRPITVHGDDQPRQLDTLEFRLPPGRLVLRLGDPTATVIHKSPDGGSTIEVKIIPAPTTEYLAEMTGINQALLGQLHPRDVLDAFDKVATILRPIGG